MKIEDFFIVGSVQLRDAKSMRRSIAEVFLNLPQKEGLKIFEEVLFCKVHQIKDNLQRS